MWRNYERGRLRCDDIEPLPHGFKGFGVSNAASIFRFVCKDMSLGSSVKKTACNGRCSFYAPSLMLVVENNLYPVSRD